jgi:hypothetical protein
MGMVSVRYGSVSVELKRSEEINELTGAQKNATHW